MLRRAWRRLAATPVFTTFAVVSLALGVGVTAAMDAVVDSIAAGGLDMPRADRIGVLVGSDPLDPRRTTWRSVLSRADLDDLRAVEGLGPVAVSAAFTQAIVAEAVAEVAVGEAVTGGYFALFGLAPHLGRLLQPADDAAPSRIVVVSHRFWRASLGSDPAAVGRVVRLGGEPFEIVGVAPPAFRGPTEGFRPATDLWVPLASTSLFPSQAAPPADPADRRRRQLTVWFDLSPGRAAGESVSRLVRAAGERLDVAHPIDLRRDPSAAPQRIARQWSVRSVAAVAAEDRAQLRPARVAVLALVTLVLVVACTNLANLMLARKATRLPELAVRAALGASRGRLIREELAESAVLAAAGALGAWVVIVLLLAWFREASLPIATSVVIDLDPRVSGASLAVAAGALVGSLVVFGLSPAVQVTQAALRFGLAAGPSAGQFRWRARRRLITLQVAISLAFFLIAVFGARAVLGERAQASGIDLDRLAIGLLNVRLPPWTEYRALESVDRLLSAAPSVPGLEAVAVLSGLPFGTTYTPVVELTRVDAPFGARTGRYPYAPLISATPTVFRTLGVPVLRGRPFDERDRAGAPAVAVLSATAARQVFGAEDAVGRRFWMRPAFDARGRPEPVEVTVVGIAADTDTERRYSRRTGAVYVPLAQQYEPVLALVVRASGDPAGAFEAMKGLARRADPDLVVERPATAAMALTGAYVLLDAASRTAGALAVLALGLAMAGLSGVLSHLVARRTAEIGVRMALGANPARVRRLVLLDGLKPVAWGIVAGWAIGLGARLMLQAAYGSPIAVSDVAVFLIAPAPIVLAAVAACYVPAARAARVDPSAALREL